MFDLILQNTASKQEFLIQHLEDTSESWLQYVFDNFKMPDEAQYGEYVGALYRNDRDDCVYTLKDVITETVIETEEGTVRVRDLRPELFILKYVGFPEKEPYLEENKNYYYYSH